MQEKVRAVHFHVLEVADGVFAAIANEGKGALANAAFVDVGDSILIFDTFNTQQAAAELRSVISDLTGKPVSHVINSHWHGDHVRGNQIFSDVTIVSSQTTRDIMSEVHPARIARQRANLPELSDYIRQLEGQAKEAGDGKTSSELENQISFLKEIEASLPTLELVLPTETFESNWALNGIRRFVECRTLGGGHTLCDSFLYIPDVKVCFIGDLLSIETHMSVMDGNIENWISILTELHKLEIDYIVPGHGPVGDKEWLDKGADYLRHLVDRANALRSAGTSPEELHQVQIPELYQNWSAKDVYGQNLRKLLDN